MPLSCRCCNSGVHTVLPASAPSSSLHRRPCAAHVGPHGFRAVPVTAWSAFEKVDFIRLNEGMPDPSDGRCEQSSEMQTGINTVPVLDQGGQHLQQGMCQALFSQTGQQKQTISHRLSPAVEEYRDYHPLSSGSPKLQVHTKPKYSQHL